MTALRRLICNSSLSFDFVVCACNCRELHFCAAQLICKPSCFCADLWMHKSSLSLLCASSFRALQLRAFAKRELVCVDAKAAQKLAAHLSRIAQQTSTRTTTTTNLDATTTTKTTHLREEEEAKAALFLLLLLSVLQIVSYNKHQEKHLQIRLQSSHAIKLLNTRLLI